jgi:hypothetical protein
MLLAIQPGTPEFLVNYVMTIIIIVFISRIFYFIFDYYMTAIAPSHHLDVGNSPNGLPDPQPR